MRKKSDKWWKKEPRSRRKCYRCNHLYSSHIDVACMKIVALKPERRGCDCRGFISSELELKIAKKRKKNTLKRKKYTKVSETPFPEIVIRAR